MASNHAPASELKRSDLARMTGCNLETIRYYESVGLMPDPPRTSSGHRRYGTAHVERLNFVMRARDLGFTMEEIRALLSLVDRGNHTCNEVERIGRHHLEVVRAKIRDLQAIKTALDNTISLCTGADTPDCPLLDVLNKGRSTADHTKGTL